MQTVVAADEGHDRLISRDIDQCFDHRGRIHPRKAETSSMVRFSGVGTSGAPSPPGISVASSGMRHRPGQLHIGGITAGIASDAVFTGCGR